MNSPAHVPDEGSGQAQSVDLRRRLRPRRPAGNAAQGDSASGLLSGIRGGVPGRGTGQPTGRRRLLSQVLRTPGGRAGVALTVALVAVGTFSRRLAPHNPFLLDVPTSRPPSLAFPMGTDYLGRDILSAVILGAGTALTVVIWVTTATAVLGVTLGTLAAQRGGWVDDAIGRLGEAVQAVPRFFLAVVVTAFFGGDLRHLITLLALTSWPLVMRLVRSEALSVTRRDHVTAAAALGASRVRVLVRHVVPGVAPVALAAVALTASRVVLLESSLSFLGLGDPEVISWGFLLNTARGFLESAWWVAVFPGLAIMAAVLGFNLLADSLDRSLDPLRSAGVPSAAE
ncbi:MAG: ABC transporter permease [Acidimicrobiales bacterium]